MKISILSCLFWRYPLERVFQIASLHGYDGVEISGAREHAYVYDMTDARCEEILSWKEKYGVEVSMFSPEIMMYPYNIPTSSAKERRDTIDYLKKAIEVARKIETPRIQLTIGHAGHGSDRKKNLENATNVMRILCDHAEKYGIDLVVEALTIMESNTVVMLDDYLEMLEKIDSPCLKGMIDTVMPMVNWEVYSDYFDKLGDKLTYIHFEDTTGYTEIHQPMGKGILDIREFLGILRRRGYDGWLSFELISKYIREPEMFSGQELRAMRHYLDLTKDVQKMTIQEEAK